MANPILTRKADTSIKNAIATAYKDGKFSNEDLVLLIRSTMDGNKLSDLEFRDLKRFLRTHPKLAGAHRRQLIGLIQLHYKLDGPFVFPRKVEQLEGAAPVGNHQCAALVQHSQPIGLTSRWREGVKVRGNGHLIKKGTAVATFEDGFYPNRAYDNHVAYYISQDGKGIKVMDQWSGKGSVSSRVMRFKGTKANGFHLDPSNNGDALSVIMRKK